MIRELRQAGDTYTPTGSDMEMKKVTDVVCTNVFKNKDTISTSLTNLWADIINTLENTGSIAHNDVVQSSTHLDTEEVGN